VLFLLSNGYHFYHLCGNRVASRVIAELKKLKQPTPVTLWALTLSLLVQAVHLHNLQKPVAPTVLKPQSLKIQNQVLLLIVLGLICKFSSLLVYALYICNRLSFVSFLFKLSSRLALYSTCFSCCP
jgi:H+/Cl- antiporter ClcA